MSSTARASAVTPNNQTPIRRAISAEPQSTNRRTALVHTPLDRSASRDLRRSVRRGNATPASAGKRSNAPTPHAKAARRALDQRRTAMFTPGKNRRKSLMEQRETPLGILRNLSKALAPTSRPVVTSSSTSASSPPSARRSRVSMLPIESEDEVESGPGDDDLLASDSPPLKRPRLSLPIDEDDEDEDELQPPRLSGVEELDNITLQSVEMPRRFLNEQAVSRLSRGSMGDLPVSDFMNELDDDDNGRRQSDFFPGLLEDLQAQANLENATLDEIDIDPGRLTVGRESDFNLEVPAGLDEQTTFLLSEPVLGGEPTSPIEERSVTGVVAENAAEPLDPVDAGSVFDLEAPIFGDDDDGPAFNDLPEYDDHADDSDPEPLPPWQDVEVAEQTAELVQRTRETIDPAVVAKARNTLQLRKKQKHVSQHGIEYPSLPSSFVKRVAQTALHSSGLSNPRVSADTLVALTQASEWFFEQLGDDLGAYATHAKRKTIEESDMITLMKRQRQIGSHATIFSVAQKHLPRELLQDIRMPAPQLAKKRGATRLAAEEEEEHVAEEEEEEDDD